MFYLGDKKILAGRPRAEHMEGSGTRHIMVQLCTDRFRTQRNGISTTSHIRRLRQAMRRTRRHHFTSIQDTDNIRAYAVCTSNTVRPHLEMPPDKFSFLVVSWLSLLRRSVPPRAPFQKSRHAGETLSMMHRHRPNWVRVNYVCCYHDSSSQCEIAPVPCTVRWPSECTRCAAYPIIRFINNRLFRAR